MNALRKEKRGARAAAATVVASLMLEGCGGSLLQSNVPAPEVYRLGMEAPSRSDASSGADEAGTAAAGKSAQSASAAAPLPLALTVARPRAADALDTHRIAVAPGASRFDYYTDVRWAESAPQMLQQVLVAALEASGRFAGGIHAAPARVPSDLMLDVELRHFEAVAPADGATPTVYVQVQASLVDSRRAARLVSFVSEAHVAARENRRPAIIDAFERASAQVVGDVVTRLQAAAAEIPATEQ